MSNLRAEYVFHRPEYDEEASYYDEDRGLQVRFRTAVIKRWSDNFDRAAIAAEIDNTEELRAWIGHGGLAIDFYDTDSSGVEHVIASFDCHQLVYFDSLSSLLDWYHGEVEIETEHLDSEYGIASHQIHLVGTPYIFMVSEAMGGCWVDEIVTQQ